MPQIFADFHLHSCFSRATSKEMNLEQLSRNALLKGLTVLGTGDFTHPNWFGELKQKLQLAGGGTSQGIFEFGGVSWIITGEVCTIYNQDGKTRKVHHVIHVPDFDVAEQIINILGKRGNLAEDGRPVFSGLTSPELVEMLMEVSDDIFIYPAHAWTSWFGALGEFSGFNSLEECYQDQTKHVHALETGMSSDPAMNWRLSALDKFTLLSNSDSHSPWTWRIGREANAFDFGPGFAFEDLTYKKLHDAIMTRKGLAFTVEVDPSYGKYHFTGHRACGINLQPSEAIRFNNICPICGRKLTVGVLQRVEKLADRSEGFEPDTAVPFKSLLPLYEIISFATGVSQLYSQRVVEQQNELIKKFGDEFNVLLNVPKGELLKAADPKIADAIIKAREGRVKYIPGYDGVYGVPVFSDEEYEKLKRKQADKAREQRSLKDF